MAGVNKVILMGNLGRDPELTYTASGMAICRLSIATSRKQKDGSELTQWHRCTAFNRRAEVIAQYFKKGSKIYVEGEIQYSQYEKDGITRYSTGIIINTFEFIDSKASDGQSGNYQNYGGGHQGPGYAPPLPQQPQQSGGYQNTSPEPPVNMPPDAGNMPQNNAPDDDDIPF